MSSFTQVAKQVAIDSGRTIRSIYYRLDRLSPEQRADDALFVQFYERIEGELIENLLKLYPDHSFYANYHSGLVNQSRFSWYVGLSGAENFRVGSSHFSVSIALEMDGELQSAVIYDGVADKIIAEASKGLGVLSEDEEQRVRIGKSDGKIENSFMLTAISAKEDDISRFTKMLRATKAQRILGDFAKDSALVVKGQYSAYYAAGFDVCTFKAVQLVAKEAGFLVTDYRGSEDVETSGNIVIAHPKLLKELLRALQI
ncbi:MAG TPA: hypothetical protein H9889_07690 [Candidatus Ignatzschineria merdigallinarum]|uniref:Inositol monophosphatase n=1 Tax=Candidatus Ignatzschineria merdigallinarum TaxID=2838621 RepID=A0A9D1TVK1_9GAMM|nr:hypothetical protein [Candidatus Ignatzschineria merdigallinarum]